MKANVFTVIVFLILILLILPNVVIGLEILIWDNDNNSYMYDPGGAGTVGCEYAIQQALLANGEDYTTLWYLPTDLSDYDIIFITLGCWCIG